MVLQWLFSENEICHSWLVSILGGFLNSSVNIYYSQGLDWLWGYNTARDTVPALWQLRIQTEKRTEKILAISIRGAGGESTG